MLTPSEQIEAYTARLKDHPTSLVFLPLAEIHFQRGHLQDAIDVCRHGLRHHGSLTKAKLLMGELLFQQGLFTESGDWLRSVLVDHPEHDVAKDFLGRIQRAGQDRQPVVVTPRPAAELGTPVEVKPDAHGGSAASAPDEAYQTTTMAELYAKQGLTADAIALYKKIVAQQPNHEQAKRRLKELEAPMDGDAPSKEELARRLATIQASLQELTAAVKNLERFIQ